MPRVPTYTADGGLNPGPVSTEADPRVFAAPARALGGLADTIDTGATILERSAARLDALKKERKAQDETAWVVSKSSELTRKTGEFLNANKNDVDVAGKFKEFADRQLKDAESQAPSIAAARLLRARNLDDVDRGYVHALAVGESVRKLNNHQAVSETAKGIFDDFRASGDVAAFDAKRAALHKDIGSIFPQDSVLTDKLRAALDTDAVDATMATNPDYARKLLKESTSIDEGARAVMLRRIDATENTVNELNAFRFKQSAQDRFEKDMADNRIPTQPSPAEYQNVFKNHWELEYEKDKQAYARAEKALIQNDENRPKAAALQAKDNAEKLKSPDQATREAAKLLAPGIAAAAKQQRDAPVDFLRQNNPDVIAANHLINNIPYEMRPAYQEQEAELLLRLQGQPPSDVSDEEKSRYLGASFKHILSPTEATQLAEQLDAASLDEKDAGFQSLLTRYNGNEALANHAYNDILTLSSHKLSATYRFAGIVENTQTRKEFIAAQKEAKSLAALTEDDIKVYHGGFSGTDYAKFEAAWIGPSKENAADVVDAKTALVNYARGIQKNSPGMGAQAAVKLAVERVVTENYGFADVNGQTIAIPRRSKDRSFRSNIEVEDIGNGLKLLLRGVDVREVATHSAQTGEPYFPTIPKALDMTKPENAQALRDEITANGYFVMSPTGNTLSLYVASPPKGGWFSFLPWADRKEPSRDGFQVTTKSGHPIQVNLDDVKRIPSRMVNYGVPTEDYMSVMRQQSDFARTNKTVRYGVPTEPLPPFFTPPDPLELNRKYFPLDGTNWPVMSPAFRIGPPERPSTVVLPAPPAR